MGAEKEDVKHEAYVAQVEAMCHVDDEEAHLGELWHEVQILRHQLALSHKREEQWKAAVSKPWWRRWHDCCCSSERTFVNQTPAEVAPLIKVDSTGGMPVSGFTPCSVGGTEVVSARWL